MTTFHPGSQPLTQFGIVTDRRCQTVSVVGMRSRASADASTGCSSQTAAILPKDVRGPAGARPYRKRTRRSASLSTACQNFTKIRLGPFQVPLDCLSAALDEQKNQKLVF